MLGKEQLQSPAFICISVEKSDHFSRADWGEGKSAHSMGHTFRATGFRFTIIEA